MKIYVVIGSTGEYSDFYEWNVCGYKDKNKAISRVNELNELVASYYDRERDGYEERENITDIIRKHPRGDKYFHIDYTGTFYLYGELEMED